MIVRLNQNVFAHTVLFNPSCFVRRFYLCFRTFVGKKTDRCPSLLTGEGVRDTGAHELHRRSIIICNKSYDIVFYTYLII